MVKEGPRVRSFAGKDSKRTNLAVEANLRREATLDEPVGVDHVAEQLEAGVIEHCDRAG
jgi:hypothetical protein